MTETISRELPASWFEIDGWAAPHRCAVRLQSRSELKLARSIIAHEVAELDRRLAPLEKRLDPKSAQYSAVQKSKQRLHFVPVVAATSPVEPATPAQRLKEYLAPPRSRAVPLAIESNCATWLARRYPLRGTVAASGFSQSDSFLASLEHFAFDIRHTGAADAALQPSLSRMSGLGRTAPNSLAGWIASLSSAELRNIPVFALSPGAGDLDARLLQFLVGPQQTVVVQRSAAASETLLALWGGDVYAAGGYLIFTNPGASFADPAQTPVKPSEAAIWPKISVVTVSYNQAEFLERCLKSVLDQDYPNLEYIVIDAVSKDGSQDILRRYEHRIGKLIIEKDQGQSDGLNKGFNLATGEILTWINSDDALAPGALKRAAVAFAMSGADVVAGGCERIDEHDALMKRHHPALPYLQPMPLGLAHQYVWHTSWAQGDYFFQPEVLFTADIWRRSGGCLKLHLHWAMDWELWIRMALAGATVFHIPATLGQSREHANQKTTVEELYLFQLKNILLEHDDALKALEQSMGHVAEGAPQIFKPVRIARSEGPRVVQLARRVWGLRDPKTFGRMLRYRLGPAFADRLEGMRFKSRFSFSGVRVVSGARYAQMRQAHEALSGYQSASRAARSGFAQQRRDVDIKTRRIEDLLTIGRSTARQIADYWMQLLFGHAASEKTVDDVQGLLATRGIAGIGRELACQNSAELSPKVWPAVRVLMDAPLAFPIRDEISSYVGSLRIAEVAPDGCTKGPRQRLAELWPCVRECFSACSDLEAALHRPDWGVDVIYIGDGLVTQDAHAGFRAALAGALVCQITTRLGPDRTNVQAFADVAALMHELGYTLVDIIGMEYQPSAALAPSVLHRLSSDRLVSADCIYVRHLDQLKAYRADELAKLAVILHEAYSKFGLAAETLQVFDEVTGSQVSQSYARGIA